MRRFGRTGRAGRMWRTALEKETERVRNRAPPAFLPLTNVVSESLAGRSAALSFETDDAAIAAFLALRPAVDPWVHQVSGAAFFAQRMASGDPVLGCGGLFCDKMRMGKTLTVLLFILQDLQARVAQGARRFREPYLICCPKSLTGVWLAELRRLVPSSALAISVVTSITAGNTDPCDIMLTTYASMRVPACVARLKKSGPFRAIFCDEGHELRNQHTVAHAELLSLETRAAWFISGTPVHNDMDNLCAALQIARVAPAGYATDEARATTLAAVYLRREGAGSGASLERLPVTWLEFASPQERTYYATASAALGEVGLQWAKAQALLNLNKLRQLCLSPALLVPEIPPPDPLIWWAGPGEGGLGLVEAVTAHLLIVDALGGTAHAVHDKIAAAFLAAHAGRDADTVHNDWADFIAAISAAKKCMIPPVSTKELFVASLLGRTESMGEKVVVFSNYRWPLERIKMQCIFRQRPENEGGRGHTALDAVLVDGTLGDTERADALRRFATDPRVGVLLITLTLGNAGHDFSCANHVVLLDPWYNPQLELQAAHRLLGPNQHRKVHIYRLALRGTVDASVIAIAESKVALAAKHLPAAQFLDATEQEQEQEQEPDCDLSDMMSIDSD